MNGFFGSCVWLENRPARRHAAADDAQPFAIRLFLEAHDLPVMMEAKDPHAGRLFGMYRQRRDGDVCVLIDVRLEEAAVVHPIQMIAGENQVVIGLVPGKVPLRLAHCVGGALKPVRVVRCLFCRDDVDEAARERVHVIALRDVMVQRRRVELRQHEDAAEIGVQTVADRDIDQPVFPADGNRGLRPLLCQRKQTGSLTAARG